MRLLLSVLLTSPALACGTIPSSLWQQTEAAATAQGLEPTLLAALVWTESRYCADAVSPAGAVGLGQLMPATARELGVDPTDSTQNLEGAARYLRTQWDTFGDWSLALAAYNAGPGAVKRYGGVPPFAETEAFVDAVLKTYRAFAPVQPAAPRTLHVYRRKRP